MTLQAAPSMDRQGTPLDKWTPGTVCKRCIPPPAHGPPPLPYRDDTNPPPHWFWGDIYKRMKRRPRCDGGED